MKKFLLIFFAYITFVTCESNNSSRCTQKIECQNDGKFNEEKCSCECLTNYIGNDCSIGK